MGEGENKALHDSPGLVFLQQCPGTGIPLQKNAEIRELPAGDTTLHHTVELFFHRRYLQECSHLRNRSFGRVEVNPEKTEVEIRGFRRNELPAEAELFHGAFQQLQLSYLRFRLIILVEIKGITKRPSLCNEVFKENPDFVSIDLEKERVIAVHQHKHLVGKARHYHLCTGILLPDHPAGVAEKVNVFLPGAVPEEGGTIPAVEDLVFNLPAPMSVLGRYPGGRCQ